MQVDDRKIDTNDPTHHPVLSLVALIVLFTIITYYIICIIRMQYNLFCFYMNCNLKSIYESWWTLQENFR